MNVRKIISSLMAGALLLGLTACSPSEEAFTCDFCGREITGTKHELEVAGEPAAACDDCYAQIKEVQAAL